jgi:Trypsin-like peptidase domain
MSYIQFQISIVRAIRRRSVLRFCQNLGMGILLAIGIGEYIPNANVRAAIFDRSGQKIPDREVNSDRVNWQMLSTKSDRKYNGIGLIDVNYGMCTGFAIATGRNPQAPAYVLTNGHCQGKSGRLPNNREILVDRSTKTQFTVNYFYDFKPKRLTIPAKRLVYGTMKHNDIAILELNITQGELKQAGIELLQIAAKPPAVGEPSIVVGVPSEGVKDSLNYLHATTCQVGETANIKEDVYNWPKSIRHHCSIVGGMSGSPMISLKTNRVVGIINTGVNDNSAKQPPCSLNRPCEVGKSGTIQTFPQENYAQLVDRIPACFDRRGIFNLDLDACQLERPERPL